MDPPARLSPRRTSPVPHLSAPRRTSSASDESASSPGDYHTAMTTPTTNHHKLSPTFYPSSHPCSDLKRPETIVEMPHDNDYPYDHEHPTKIHASDVYYTHNVRRNSYDQHQYPTDVYAHDTPEYSHTYHRTNRFHPYNGQRPRGNSNPVEYSTATTFVQHETTFYSPPHSPAVYRGTASTGYYSTPPTPQDRRKAHILSEMKRRESINSGFEDLLKLLTSDDFLRAISLSCDSIRELESDAKTDYNTILGGERKNSKAVILQKAVRALDYFGKTIIHLHEKPSPRTKPVPKKKNKKRNMTKNDLVEADGGSEDERHDNPVS
jgi:hypothetical protein